MLNSNPLGVGKFAEVCFGGYIVLICTKSRYFVSGFFCKKRKRLEFLNDMLYNNNVNDQLKFFYFDQMKFYETNVDL